MVHINFSRAAASFILLSLLLAVSRASAQVPQQAPLQDPHEECSKTCLAQNCSDLSIRYGKYCGISYTGCPGEKPCDAIDACCMGHDDCVTKFGMTHVKCHFRLKNCLARVFKSGNPGFSKVCPARVVVPTMMHGMDLGILYSQIANSLINNATN